MIRTYVIENDLTKQVMAYHTHLSNAKKELKSLPIFCSVLAIKGQTYGEGFHQYRIKYINKKFRKVKI